jgi:hypothetical protein
VNTVRRGRSLLLVSLDSAAPAAERTHSGSHLSRASVGPDAASGGVRWSPAGQRRKRSAAATVWTPTAWLSRHGEHHIRPSRSSAICTILQPDPILRGIVQGQVAQSGIAGSADAVLSPGPLAVSQLQLGDRAGGVGGERGQHRWGAAGHRGVRRSMRTISCILSGQSVSTSSASSATQAPSRMFRFDRWSTLRPGWPRRRHGWRRCYADRVGQPPAPSRQPVHVRMGAARGVVRITVCRLCR